MDGTAQIKRALLDVFYELDKARGDAVSLFGKRLKQATAALRDKFDQPIGVLASSMVDPDEEPYL